VVYGANYVNGWRVEPLVAALPSTFCVVSVIPTTPARSQAFAQDRGTGSRSGGQRPAEVILYTRVTDTRRRVPKPTLCAVAEPRGTGLRRAELPQVPAVLYAAPVFLRVEGDGTAALGQLTAAAQWSKRQRDAGAQRDLWAGRHDRVEEGPFPLWPRPTRHPRRSRFST
jgi:hypothetical protein